MKKIYISIMSIFVLSGVTGIVFSIYFLVSQTFTTAINSIQLFLFSLIVFGISFIEILVNINILQKETAIKYDKTFISIVVILSLLISFVDIILIWIGAK